MKSFCISLAKEKEKWPELDVNFKKNGIHDIIMFPAVNGKEFGLFYEHQNDEKISPKTLKLINQFSNLENIVSTWGLYHLKNKTNRRDHSQLGSWGAVGCALSHLLIWKKMVDENIKHAMIFEDDIHFEMDFQKKLEEVLQNFPPDADAVMLDTIVNFHPLKYNELFDEITSTFFGMHAYIMTKRGAEKLLKNAFPIEVQIDGYLGYCASLKRVKLYATKNMCRQKMHLSSIQTPCIICDLDDNEVGRYRTLTKIFISLFLIFIVVLLLFSIFVK